MLDCRTSQRLEEAVVDRSRRHSWRKLVVFGELEVVEIATEVLSRRVEVWGGGEEGSLLEERWDMLSDACSERRNGRKGSNGFEETLVKSSLWNVVV
jgi:hypothetical protein